MEIDKKLVSDILATSGDVGALHTLLDRRASAEKRKKALKFWVGMLGFVAVFGCAGIGLGWLLGHALG